MNSVNNGENSKMLKEIVWCDHLKVSEMPWKGIPTPHIFLHDCHVYIVVEENKVKMVCPICWIKSAVTPPKFSREF